MAKNKLTPKQQIFCLEYLKDMNGARAAIAAKYSKNTARQTAYEILTKPYVQEYLTRQLDKVTEKLELDAEEVIGKVMVCRDRCLQDLTPKVEKDPDGNWIETGEFLFDSRGVLKASELLMRHLGLLNDKLKLSGGLNQMSDEELEAKIAEQERKRGAS